MVVNPFDIAEGKAKEENPFDVVENQLPVPGWGQTVLHGAETTASGFNKGLASVLGFPVDIINLALKPVGMSSETPVGGAQWLNKYIMPEEMRPSGPVETTLHAVGEQAGAMVPAMVIPGASLKQIIGPAIMAGGASGLARTQYPGNETVDVIAQLLGAAAGSPSAMRYPLKFFTEPKLERNMYERAMKPSTTLKEAERTKRIETALNENIPVTKGGLEKSKNTIAEINDEIQGKINALNQQAVTVNKYDVLNPVREIKTSELPLPKQARSQISDVVGEFIETHPQEIPIGKAQKFKQYFNKELDDFYKALQTSPDKTTLLASKWTAKTKAKIADGLREEISQVFPEISNLNQREGSLIQLNKSLERAVNRISQHDLWSIKGVISASVGFVKNPWTATKLAVMNYVLNNSGVQSRLAIAIRNSRSKAINLTGLTGEAIKQSSEQINQETLQSPNEVPDYTKLGIPDWREMLEGRQYGGPVNSGTSYIVGENGPEIIMPRNDGTVIPILPQLDYPVRDKLHSGEETYFKENPHVTGMAAGDNSIILNPYSNLNEQQKQAVIKNEAIRLGIRNRKPDLSGFNMTQEQLNNFKGTPYENGGYDTKATAISRILSGDLSFRPTLEQIEFANKLYNILLNTK